MKFRFKGTQACPEEILLRDVLFPKGKTVEVDDALAAKLMRLDYFEQVKPGRRAKQDDENVA